MIISGDPGARNEGQGKTCENALDRHPTLHVTPSKLGCLRQFRICLSSDWFFGGFDIAGKLSGPVFLLLLMIPIPLNFDLKLVIWLQKVATAAASSLLDMLQVWHNTSGVAITTVQRSFMVEEASSKVSVYGTVDRKYALSTSLKFHISTMGIMKKNFLFCLNYPF